MKPLKPLLLRRLYQQAVVDEFIMARARFWALLWERQAGKSSTLADFAFYEMLRGPNRTVIYGSASLLLAQEITLKAAVRANQTVSQMLENDAALLRQFAEAGNGPIPAKLLPAGKTARDVKFKTFDAATNREIISGSGARAKRISAAGFAELFSQQRLEFRVYHSPTSYSRTKVIAPNIATARSWSGTVLLDEVAFIRNLREMVTALLPVISTDKQFKLILSTTPPEFDDTHYSFELLAPPAGREFPTRAEGNWYWSESRVRVHRADAFDTALAGKKIFDLRSGAEVGPMEAFQRAPNKDGHRIAHWLSWMAGGSAACDLLRLRTAQERGARQCQNFQINSDADMTPALNWLFENAGGNRESLKRPIGLGFDVATTTLGKSNPSVISVMEEHGPEWLVRARFIWKTRDPETANQRVDAILDVLGRRGARPRALAQDATNERYFAEQTRKRLRARVPVLLMVASEAVDLAGLDKPTNWKEYLGHRLVAKLDDNNLTLPPDDYTRADYRLVMRDRGRFVCQPNDQGMHGDCFDADKLAGHALTAVSARRTVVPPLPPQ